MDKEQRYFNFPIVLLEGFLENDRDVLDNIFNYALYVKTLEYEYGDEVEQIKSAENFFSVKAGNKKRTYENGESLYNSIPERTPIVGLNKDILFDYYKNDKTDFQKVCLLGFLGIKSILQNKAYCKIDNKYWLSRMDGKTKSVNEVSELSSSVKKYYTTKYTRKIKSELIHNWGLVHYSYFTRGFYVSFKLNLEQLVYEAEKRRKSTLEKQLKIETQNARLIALHRLKNSTP